MLVGEHIHAHHDEIDTAHDRAAQELQETNQDVNGMVDVAASQNGGGGRTIPQADNINTTDIV